MGVRERARLLFGVAVAVNTGVCVLSVCDDVLRVYPPLAATGGVEFGKGLKKQGLLINCTIEPNKSFLNYRPTTSFRSKLN